MDNTSRILVKTRERHVVKEQSVFQEPNSENGGLLVALSTGPYDMAMSDDVIHDRKGLDYWHKD
ncbi:MAG: hypothetical protein H0X47_15635 [Nitrospirales bacterium]|nr:hypothetical protein [Nitrospirales bacterium]